MEEPKVEQLDKKAEKKLQDKIRRAKWMVYEGPDVLIVPSNNKEGKDLVFRMNAPTNVTGYTNLIASYPRLVEVIASGKLKVISPKEAQKITDDQKALWETAKDRPQNCEMRRVIGGDPSLEEIANQTQNFAIFKEKAQQTVEQIDLGQEVESSKNMSMEQLLQMADQFKKEHPEAEPVEQPSIFPKLKELLSANGQERERPSASASVAEKMAAPPVEVSASASALDEMRENGHRMVDSVVGLLAAWKKFRS